MLNPDPPGRTAVIEAVLAGHPDALEILIQAGADLEVKERTIGLAALHWTGGCSRGAESAKLLLAAGADIETRQSRVGATPLIWAATYGDVEVIRVLLAAGADVSATDALGDTALSRATKRGHLARGRTARRTRRDNFETTGTGHVGVAGTPGRTGA